MNRKNIKLSVIGLGYVGLPLAVEFGKYMPVIGFDINQNRIKDLKSNIDNTLELTKEEIIESNGLSFTSNIDDLEECNIYIVTVPTPIDKENLPDLSPLKSACISIGKILKKNDVVIFESTVYPGTTEEICVPILEESSKLVFNKDIYAGNSPERIKPGDKIHTIANIKKITSGSTPEIAEFIDQIYSIIVKAGTYKVDSIKVAEAAKVIENTQRDLNIALMNELSLIFNKLEINTQEVLKAAGTKWNFLNFQPGLVGGHCIGVDPYYLTYKAQEVGYEPEIILAGRKLNDSMAGNVANRFLNALKVSALKETCDLNILVMGIAFKENCPDIRNSKVIDLIYDLKKYSNRIDIYDPWVHDSDIENLKQEFSFVDAPAKNKYDGIIIAVAHEDFINLGINKIRSFGNDKHIIFDVKYCFSHEETDLRL